MTDERREELIGVAMHLAILDMRETGHPDLADMEELLHAIESHGLINANDFADMYPLLPRR